MISVEEEIQNSIEKAVGNTEMEMDRKKFIHLKERLPDWKK